MAARVYFGFAAGTFGFSAFSEEWAYYFSDRLTSRGVKANKGMVHYNIFFKSSFRGLTWPVYILQMYTGSFKKPIYQRNGYAFTMLYHKE